MNYSDVRAVCRPLEARGEVERKLASILDAAQVALEGENEESVEDAYVRARAVDVDLYFVKQVDSELAAGKRLLVEMRDALAERYSWLTGRDVWDDN